MTSGPPVALPVNLTSAVVSPDAPRGLAGGSGRHHGDLREMIFHHDRVKKEEKILLA